MDARTPEAEIASQAHWRPDRCDRVALVLQGGGALGAYQAGVYQALHEAGLEPDWVCGEVAPLPTLEARAARFLEIYGMGEDV